jgi:hypothetical protein
MASTPHPPPKPEPPKPPPPQPSKSLSQTEQHAAPPPPVETVADEQRARSAEMEKIGVEAWMAAHNKPPESEPASKKA